MRLQRRGHVVAVYRCDRSCRRLVNNRAVAFNLNGKGA